MADTLKKDAQTSNVLVWRPAEEFEDLTVSKDSEEEESKRKETEQIEIGDHPYWELEGKELAYPLTIEEQGRTFRIYFLMSNFESFETERVRIDSTTPLKVEGAEFETVRVNPASIIEFIDEHFVKLLGVSGDAAKHRNFLNERPYLKTRLWNEVITQPRMFYEEDGGSQNLDLISLAEASDRWYEMRPKLFCPDRKMEGTLNLRHCLKKSSQTDFNDFEMAVGGRYNTRLREFKTTLDYTRLRKIYSNLVSQVKGYLVNGAPCTEVNKKWWLKKMPLDHVLTIVDEAFSQVRSKNA